MKSPMQIVGNTLLIVLLFSCKKGKDDPSHEQNKLVQKQVSGSWLWISVANDYNHNNLIDSGETYGYPDTMARVLLKLSENGNGENKQVLRHDTLPVSTFQWEITDNGKRILFRNLFGVNTQYRLLNNTSASRLILTDTGTVNGTFGTSWFFYERI